jgi:hypothetical protein
VLVERHFEHVGVVELPHGVVGGHRGRLDRERMEAAEPAGETGELVVVPWTRAIDIQAGEVPALAQVFQTQQVLRRIRAHHGGHIAAQRVVPSDGSVEGGFRFQARQRGRYLRIPGHIRHGLFENERAAGQAGPQGAVHVAFARPLQGQQGLVVADPAEAAQMRLYPGQVVGDQLHQWMATGLMTACTAPTKRG